MLEEKNYKYITVKAYAKLIDKSDKTVYKMIKDGLVTAKKKEKTYAIRVDNFMLNRCEDITKSLYTMKELMQGFESRLKELEEKSSKKSVLKKIKVAVKKPIKKGSIKKSIKKSKLLKPKKKITKQSKNSSKK
ncbi:MAG: hypothetical protein COA44_05460 [Arcobacter sp.]|nr:MAG: hypothetical protein COA44_05460 [Arcobacter sp.]